MNIQQLDAFNTLLSAWRNHQQLRDAGASLNDLNESAIRLDDARYQAALTR